ncbi:uncharacterized protein LOC131166911 [Malania oleifera]|uniref:uncharacterized protein LOC131166911 n=1 Tax=Malania oleifera TaxID=397392 RepID=UPI0025AE84E7|nr:uncharacterized protein LOC131166911 [Malania oleifera]
MNMDDVKRWNVTYTKHIKRKRKVYQDGVLVLHSLLNKVVLYDECEKLLNSRFLKKDEFVESGETVALDTFLVDIGDPKGDPKPLPESNFLRRDQKITGKGRLMHGQSFGNNSACVDRKTCAEKNKEPSSIPSSSHKIIREWQVLYTTQITQKAKKYHDGILQLAICGSQGRQVILLNEGRATLSSKYLKSSECVSTGSTIEIQKYLAEVGEPWTSSEGEFQNDNCFRKDADSSSCSLSTDRIKLSMKVSKKKPLRDAHQILSILKRPMALENIANMTKTNMEQCHVSESTDLVQFDLKDKVRGQLEQDPKSLNTDAVENHEYDFKVLEERVITMQPHKNETSVPRAVYNDVSRDIIRFADSEKNGLNSSTPSSLSIGSGASNILRPYSDAASPDESRMRQASCTYKHHISDSDTIHVPEDSQAPSAMMPLNGSAESTSTGESLGQTSSNPIGGMESDPRWSEKTFISGLSRSSAASQGPYDVKRERSEEPINVQDSNACPSYDLGF